MLCMLCRRQWGQTSQASCGPRPCRADHERLPVLHSLAQFTNVKPQAHLGRVELCND